MGCSGTQPLVLWYWCRCCPSTPTGSPWCPSAPKKHLLLGTSHSFWSALQEADHELQRGGSGCQAHNAEEYSYPMPTFLKSNTCSTVVHPLACTFREEEPQSAHGCSRDEYAVVVDDPYIRGGVPPPLWHPLSIPQCCES
jgi:hypothetical protein